MKRWALVCLGLSMSGCALTFEVQNRPREIARTEIDRGMTPYLLHVTTKGDTLFVQIESDEGRPVTVVERVTYQNQKSMTSESGSYVGRIWFIAGDTWGRRTTDRSFWMIPMSNCLFLIPSLGISGIVTAVDLLTLPVRLMIPGEEYQRTESREHPPGRLVDPSERVSCEGMMPDENGGIPLTRVLAPGRISIHCIVTFREKEIGMHRIPLSRLAQDSPVLARALGAERAVLMKRLDHYVSSDTLRDFPTGNRFLDREVHEVALALYPRDEAALRITALAAYLASGPSERNMVLSDLRREISLERGRDDHPPP